MTVNKIIYTNGILTDPTAAQQTATQIHELTSVETEVVHNSSTQSKTAAKIAYNLVEGFSRLAWSVYNGDNDQRVKGLSALNKAVNAWSEIQEGKKACAESLVGRVERYLDLNPNHEILLVFHSQGTHVGFQALENLSHLKGRIHVVSIGGMVSIPSEMAKTVANFYHTDDYVTSYIAPIMGSGGKWIEAGKGGHNASSYLSNPALINHLLDKRILVKDSLLYQYFKALLVNIIQFTRIDQLAQMVPLKTIGQ
jgi:hypothetical protein